VLVRTRNSADHWWEKPFTEHYVHLSLDAAQVLADQDVRLVGIDYLSIGEFGRGAETHQVLLGAGIPVLEGLDLSSVSPGTYHLICLPLRLASRDGAPARAVLIEED
jgi:arylformamidase